MIQRTLLGFNVNVKAEPRLPPELPGDDAAARRAQNPIPAPSGDRVGKWRWVAIAVTGWFVVGIVAALILMVALAFIAQYLITHSGGH